MMNLTDCPKNLRAITQVLCIDSDPNTIHLLTKLFKQAGYTEHLIHTASNAHQATQYLSTSDSYDIVLVNFDLPDASGKDVVRNFVTQYPEIPFIGLINKDDPEQFSAHAIGVSEFIAKPLDNLSFIQTVEAICDNYVGYDADEQTGADLYAIEAAERILEQNELIHWFANQFSNQFGHFLEMDMEIQTRHSSDTPFAQNRIEKQIHANLLDMLSVSMAFANEQDKRKLVCIEDLIRSVTSHLGNRYHITYHPHKISSKINIDPRFMTLVLSQICQICYGQDFHWEIESENKQITIKITSLDTPLMFETDGEWLMIQSLLRVYQAKIVRTYNAISISLPS